MSCISKMGGGGGGGGEMGAFSHITASKQPQVCTECNLLGLADG